MREDSWPPPSSGHESGLLNWAKSLWLATATRLTWTYVMAVPPVVSGLHVRKCRTVAHFVDVDAVSNACAELRWVRKDTGDDARGDVHNVVIEASSVRETSVVA